MSYYKHREKRRNNIHFLPMNQEMKRFPRGGKKVFFLRERREKSFYFFTEGGGIASREAFLLLSLGGKKKSLPTCLKKGRGESDKKRGTESHYHSFSAPRGRRGGVFIREDSLSRGIHSS